MTILVQRRGKDLANRISDNCRRRQDPPVFTTGRGPHIRRGTVLVFYNLSDSGKITFRVEEVAAQLVSVRFCLKYRVHEIFKGQSHKTQSLVFFRSDYFTWTSI
jgi:hypothetical protein